jgi:hypothetical protein
VKLRGKRYFPWWTGRVSFLFIRGFMNDKNRRMPPVPAGHLRTDTRRDVERTPRWNRQPPAKPVNNQNP